MKKLGIIGFGQMGKTIAISALLSEREVCVVSKTDKTFNDSISFILDKLKKMGRSELISNLTRVASFDDCSLVIESVSENILLKKEVISTLSKSYKGIIVSNTSSFSINTLQACCLLPERFMGLHFMNPAHVMPLVELVVGEKTSEDTILRVMSEAKDLKKTAITVKDSPGFIVNRILFSLLCSAVLTLSEGISSKEDIDTAMKKGCGFPMGPFELLDLIGLDVSLSIIQEIMPSHPAKETLSKYVLAGKFGKKSGEGFYVYPR